MKKVILFAAAIVALAFASCGGSEKPVATTDSDSVAVDTVVTVDTVAADSVVADSVAA